MSEPKRVKVTPRNLYDDLYQVDRALTAAEDEKRRIDKSANEEIKALREQRDHILTAIETGQGTIPFGDGE